MRTTYSMQSRVFVPLSLLVLFLLACTFASCGSASTSTGGTGTGAATSSPTTTPTSVKGYGTVNGCPSDMVVANTSQKPNVTIQPSDVNTTVTAHNGDVIEVHLPFGHKWSGPLTSQGVLQLQQPAGYAVKADSVCVWRFIAQGTGTTQLTFTGRALCKAGQMCPMFIVAEPFKITVQ